MRSLIIQFEFPQRRGPFFLVFCVVPSLVEETKMEENHPWFRKTIISRLLDSHFPFTYHRHTNGFILSYSIVSLQTFRCLTLPYGSRSREITRRKRNFIHIVETIETAQFPSTALNHSSVSISVNFVAPNVDRLIKQREQFLRVFIALTGQFSHHGFSHDPVLRTLTIDRNVNNSLLLSQSSSV